MHIGIDLLWVRPGLCGGTESFIRNLMNGFAEYDTKNQYLLFTAKDNYESFAQYQKYSHIKLKCCPVQCSSQPKRILWENFHLDKTAQKENIDVMLIPVYSKPSSFKNSIPYVSVIHDLQALHYPQYFSFFKRCFLKYSWYRTCKTSAAVVTISDYCKEDLIANFPFVKEKIQTIYNPILVENTKISFSEMEKKYGIEAGNYYYCVSSMLPHKNLDTILKVIAECKKQGEHTFFVISGVGGQKQEFQNMVKQLGIENQVIQTGFVSNAERDSLYENCKLFLFPSVFEGFGMPPIEAMRKGKKVVMTKESCLLEVTEGKAFYVDNPFDIKEWIGQMQKAENAAEKMEKFEKYDLENIVKQYIEILRKTGYSSAL